MQLNDKAADALVRVMENGDAETARLRLALMNLLPPRLDWKEAGNGKILIEVRKEDLRAARVALGNIAAEQIGDRK